MSPAPKMYECNDWPVLLQEPDPVPYCRGEAIYVGDVQELYMVGPAALVSAEDLARECLGRVLLVTTSISAAFYDRGVTELYAAHSLDPKAAKTLQAELVERLQRLTGETAAGSDPGSAEVDEGAEALEADEAMWAAMDAEANEHRQRRQRAYEDYRTDLKYSRD